LDKANQGHITPAEMDILLRFDQGQLYSFEQARDLSVALLEEWLCKYKFKNWTETETQKLQVTEDMKRDRAREIANNLNDVKKWRSHGLGINMHQLRDVLKLKIDDFGQSQELNEVVRRYHKLLTDYMGKMSHRGLVQTREKYTPLIIG
jgi:hypothetical protein